MEKGRPLQALHNVEVDDVDAVAAVEGLEDGLVGGEVGEFDEGGDVVVDLHGGVDRFDVDQRGGDADPRVDDSA